MILEKLILSIHPRNPLFEPKNIEKWQAEANSTFFNVVANCASYCLAGNIPASILSGLELPSWQQFFIENFKVGPAGLLHKSHIFDSAKDFFSPKTNISEKDMINEIRSCGIRYEPNVQQNNLRS